MWHISSFHDRFGNAFSAQNLLLAAAMLLTPFARRLDPHFDEWRRR